MKVMQDTIDSPITRILILMFFSIEKIYPNSIYNSAIKNIEKPISSPGCKNQYLSESSVYIQVFGKKIVPNKNRKNPNNVKIE